ncbi:MAG TPA: GGDEF domain-containing protein [Burkholderiales bacterium]|nr:GGDEF domain-containing protein [Burkholderiales bacterium]
MYTLFPRDDPKQALRIRRLFIASASYLMMFALMGIANLLDLLDARTTLHIVAAGVAVNLALYGVIRGGHNLRFRDPSFTALQVSMSLAMVSYGMYFADTSRGAFLLVYLVVVLFGVFRLSTRELLGISGFAFASYGAVIGLALRYKPGSVVLEVELLQWALLGAVLPWFALLGGHLSALRRETRDKNRQLQSALATIQEMATRDELTGAYNRRYLMDRLHQEQLRSDRGKGTLCVCMMDIDFFKRINDRHGHAAGDRVLRIFAEVSQSGLRATDCFARYGGEEFVLLLSDTPLQGAMIVAERVRRRIEETAFADLGIARVTASFGVAQYHAPEAISTTLARADKALYRAKTSGRNRVACDVAANDNLPPALPAAITAAPAPRAAESGPPAGRDSRAPAYRW